MHPSLISIRNSATVYLLTLFIIVAGVQAYRYLPREAAPDIQVPLLIVSLPYPGASPEDVESLVTRKAELALQNVQNLKKIKSTSAEGVSTITLEFQLGFNVDDARTKVREKLDSLRPKLPGDVEDPIIAEINLSEQPMVIVNLAGEVGLVTLKDVAEDLRDEVEAIPGILEVTRAGGLEKEVKVRVDPDKLRYYTLTLNQVAGAISRENTNIPGGSIEMGPTKYLIRVPGEFNHPEEINDVVIAAPDQNPIFVRDVARVAFDFKEQTSLSRLDGKDSVSLVIIKRSGEHLLEIREKIRALVETYQKKYEGRIRFSFLADQGVFVERIVHELENNIITGFLMVFVVLVLTMGLRNSLFVATAIPLSFLLTLVLLQMMGYTLNFVVLFSLILALGMLVDNAIVVVENSYRHMQSGKGRVQSAIDGIREVAIPITTSTLTTVVAFAPVIYMPGIVGRFMSYLPVTVIIALMASLFVGLVINPVMCSTLMATPKTVHEDMDEVRLVERSAFLNFYRRVLEWNLDRPWKVIIGMNLSFVFIVVIYGVTTLSRKGVEFFPTNEPETATITINNPAGTTLLMTDQSSRQVERMVLAYKENLVNSVANVGQRQGFGGNQSGSSTSHMGYVKMEFLQWQDWVRRPSEVLEDLRKELEQVVGADVKLSKASMGPPTGAPVNIEVRGKNFAHMLSAAETIKQSIRDIPGLINLGDDFDRSRPEIRVLIDREKTARMGLRSEEVANIIRMAFQGRKVSEYREGRDEYDIIVRLDESFRLGPRDLERLYLPTPGGQQVPLSELARITTGPAYGAIRHIGLDRVITVSGFNATGVPGPVLLGKVRERLKTVSLPEGLTLSYTGENEDRAESQSFLGRSFLVALFLIFIVLVMEFNSFMVPLIILSSVVLSFMGVLIGLILHQKPFSVVMGGIGVISLAGVAVNNAIVLIDYTLQLRRGGVPLREAVTLAGMVRMRPVLLTAGATILGLVPIAAGIDIDFFRWPVLIFGGQGGAFWLPMALAMMYGLFIATIMTLIWVPLLYFMVESGKEKGLGRLRAGLARGLARTPLPALAGWAWKPLGRGVQRLWDWVAPGIDRAVGGVATLGAVVGRVAGAAALRVLGRVGTIGRHWLGWGRSRLIRWSQRSRRPVD